jgi:hypothetical protein
MGQAWPEDFRRVVLDPSLVGLAGIQRRSAGLGLRRSDRLGLRRDWERRWNWQRRWRM